MIHSIMNTNVPSLSWRRFNRGDEGTVRNIGAERDLAFCRGRYLIAMLSFTRAGSGRAMIGGVRML